MIHRPIEEMKNELKASGFQVPEHFPYAVEYYPDAKDMRDALPLLHDELRQWYLYAYKMMTIQIPYHSRMDVWVYLRLGSKYGGCSRVEAVLKYDEREYKYDLLLSETTIAHAVSPVGVVRTYIKDTLARAFRLVSAFFATGVIPKDEFDI